MKTVIRRNKSSLAISSAFGLLIGFLLIFSSYLWEIKALSSGGFLSYMFIPVMYLADSIREMLIPSVITGWGLYCLYFKHLSDFILTVSIWSISFFIGISLFRIFIDPKASLSLSWYRDFPALAILLFVSFILLIKERRKNNEKKNVN